MSTKTFVSVAQLTAITGLPEQWLRCEAEAGRIPHLRVGNKKVFNPAAVERSLIEMADRTLKVKA